jgi:hypothetical protein
MRNLRGSLLTVWLLATASIVSAQYTFTSLIDPLADSNPGSPGTQPSAIYGDTVVGSYFNSGWNGFTETGGVYTTIDDPNGFETYATGISGNTIVGLFAAGLTTHGYSETGGVFTTIDPPGSGLTEVTGISGDTIVGSFVESSGSIIGPSHAFTLTNGVYSIFDDPNGINDTGARGISGSTVVGDYVDSAGQQHGFTEAGGSFTTFDDPNATGPIPGDNDQGTTVYGVFNGVVAGTYTDDSGITHGFTESEGIYTTIDVPGATATEIFGMNGDTLVGDYIEDGVGKGFVATPTPDTGATLLMLGLAVISLARLRRKLAT